MLVMMQASVLVMSLLEFAGMEWFITGQGFTFFSACSS